MARAHTPGGVKRARFDREGPWQPVIGIKDGPAVLEETAARAVDLCDQICHRRTQFECDSHFSVPRRPRTKLKSLANSTAAHQFKERKVLHRTEPRITANTFRARPGNPDYFEILLIERKSLSTLTRKGSAGA
jgi:hypothetical protein